MIINKLGAGHYETREGYPVVILCLDAPGSHPVVGYYILKNQIVAECWKENGCYSEEEEVSTLDLRPVQRKPREVWVSNEDLSTEAGVRVASVSDPGIEGFVHFREVMEDK